MAAACISWVYVGATLVAAGAWPMEPGGQLANTTQGPGDEQSALTSLFSPRMDFEQWRPLTGRGDPLRNDPTYDYEPPVLERVHYWADERFTGGPRPERGPTPEPLKRPEREPRPHAKVELLMLGVTSRKPSPSLGPSVVPSTARLPGPPYEDYTYKLSVHYPMTILVPPPPPVPAALTPAPGASPPTSPPPDHLSSSFALQESNLIYQSSSTHSWTASPTLTEDYMGWGPTAAPPGAPHANDSHNLVSSEHSPSAPPPLALYKSMLSEAPHPPRNIPGPVMIPTFLPTVLPPTLALESTTELALTPTPVTGPTERTTPVLEPATESAGPVAIESGGLNTRPEPTFTTASSDMLGPMMSMPLGGEEDTHHDNLYAFSSENVQVFGGDRDSDRDSGRDIVQSMRPPQLEAGPFYVDALTARGPAWHTPERSPSRHTAPSSPTYLIIQGHSKVKTYGSKPVPVAIHDTITNEIPKPEISDQVKHLHAKKSTKKLDTTDVNRRGRPKNLRSLLDGGYGSTETQWTELGVQQAASGVPGPHGRGPRSYS